MPRPAGVPVLQLLSMQKPFSHRIKRGGGGIGSKENCDLTLLKFMRKEMHKKGCRIMLLHYIGGTDHPSM